MQGGILLLTDANLASDLPDNEILVASGQMHIASDDTMTDKHHDIFVKLVVSMHSQGVLTPEIMAS